MSAVIRVLRQVAGLFVEDGWLALAILGIVALAAVLALLMRWSPAEFKTGRRMSRRPSMKPTAGMPSQTRRKSLARLHSCRRHQRARCQTIL